MYVVVDIGCIECGEPSKVVGVFEWEEEDLAAMHKQAREQDCYEGVDVRDSTNYFSSGQHRVVVYVL